MSGIVAMNKVVCAFMIGICFSALAFGDTTQNGAIFTIDEGVDFEIGNTGASNFLFNWTDPDGGPTFTNIADPTLILTAGETYTFVRTTTAHPFIIMDETAGSFISGTDGAYFRTTTNGSLLDDATLKPIADFTADPFPSGDVITWNPTFGDYWYTCRVTSHTTMTGRISVVPEPSSLGFLGFVGLGLAHNGRRRNHTSRT